MRMNSVDNESLVRRGIFPRGQSHGTSREGFECLSTIIIAARVMYHVTVHADSGSVAFTRERMLPCDTEERTRPCGPSSPAAARRPRQRDRRGYHIDAGIKANESLADRYSIATERKLGKSGREPNQPSRCARTMASYHRGK